MTRRARILLVDDEIPLQKSVERLLRSRGYEVDVGSQSITTGVALFEPTRKFD